MHIRLKWCPQCKAMLSVETRGGGPWESKLGAPTKYPCGNCGTLLTDGMKEWDDMDFIDRIIEIAHSLLLGLIVAPLFGLGIGALASALVGVKGMVLCWVFAASLPLYFAYRRIVDIRDSKRRTRNRQRPDLV